MWAGSANALKRALPAISGDLRDVTQQRIVMLEHNSARLAHLNGEKSQKDTLPEYENAVTGEAFLA